MRIELEDILDEEISPIDVHHLGDALIRFRLEQQRLPSPYHRFLLERDSATATLLPDAPNRSAVEHNLEAIRRQLAEALVVEQRDRPLLRAAGVETVDELLRFNADHFCRPDWLYTNGQMLATVVSRSPAIFEVIVHPSLEEFLQFGWSYGPWPLVEAGRGARFGSHPALESWIGQRLSRLVVKCLGVARGDERSTAFLQEAGVRSRSGRRVRTFLIHHQGTPRRERLEAEEPYAFLNRLDLDGFRPHCCATCSHFGFSAMSRDMSGGARGYCARREGDAQAVLPENALVSVFDTCKLYEAVPDVQIQRRCTRCGQLFREAENGDSACRYHPGQLLDYDLIGRSGQGAPGDFWDCCKRQVQSDGRSVPGCATGRHVEADPTIPAR